MVADKLLLKRVSATATRTIMLTAINLSTSERNMLQFCRSPSLRLSPGKPLKRTEGIGQTG